MVFTGVGRKFILLLACSILNVYKGVVELSQVTAATVTTAEVTRSAAKSTVQDRFTVITSFQFASFLIGVYKFSY
jgi:hypothetical protein